MSTQKAVKHEPTPERLMVGARIRAARRHAHMKQAELALAVGVSQGKVSTWECGEFVPDITEWVRLAQVTQDFGMLDLRTLAPTLQVTDRKLAWLSLDELEPSQLALPFREDRHLRAVE